MTVQLKLDELLEIVQTKVDTDKGEVFEDMLLHIANLMAQCIDAEADDDGASPFRFAPASNQGTAFGGLCVGFSPTTNEDEDPGPVPELIAGYDDEGWG